jgi:ribosomal protein S27E
VGKAADWLREERRKTLGDWVAICAGCGHGQRYFEGSAEEEVAPGCPTCGQTMLTRCPGCGARVSSMFAVGCEDCGEGLRPAEQFGTRIRRAE